MILLRMLAYAGVGVAIIIVEVTLAAPSRGAGSCAARRSDQLMTMGSAAALLTGMWSSVAAPSVPLLPAWCALLLGVGLGLFGVGLRGLAMHQLGESYHLTPTVDDQQTLITTGLYRLLRHPGYLGIVVSLLGLQVLIGTWVSLAAMLFVVLPLPIRISLEERMLAEHFGARYLSYCARTRYRLMPGMY